MSEVFEKGKRNTLVVKLVGTKSGIGLRIVGGQSVHSADNFTGIFIKDIIPGSLAERHGGLKVGDQLLKANSDSLEGVSNEKAYDILRNCADTDMIVFTIARDKIAQDDFHRLSQDIPEGTGDRPPTLEVAVTREKGMSKITNISNISNSPPEMKRPTPGNIELVDVRLSVGSSSTFNDGESSPPPLPTSLPPDEEESLDMPTTQHTTLISSDYQSVARANKQAYVNSKNSAITTAGHGVHHFAPSIASTGATNTLSPSVKTTEVGSEFSGASSTQKRHQESRFSVDTSNKFRLEKLIWAVEYIGTKLSTEHREKLYEQLHIDANGKVVFMEFLQLVREMIPSSKLDQSKLIEAFTAGIGKQQYVGGAASEVKLLKDSIEHLRNENRELLVTVQKLKNELQSEVQARENLSETKIMKNLAAKECELKKLEASNRRYQVAIDILVKFGEDCHEALVKSTDIIYYPHGTGAPVIRGDQLTGNPRPPQYLSKDIKKTSASLASEAKNVLAEVRRILSVQALPYGWEEQYTEDGRMFYVNHDAQCTSWVHPVTKQLPTTST